MPRLLFARLAGPVLGLLGLLVAAREADALLITELMPSNAATIADDDGEFSHWIEIFNNGGSTANLDGHYLTDVELAPTKW